MQIIPPINTNTNNEKRRGRRMVVPLLLLGYSLLSANLTAGHNIPVDGSPPIDGSSDDSTASMDEVRLPGDRDKRELPSSTPRASAELMGIHEEDIRLKRDEDDDTPLHEDYEAEKSDVAMAQMIEAAAALNGTLANEEHQHHHDDEHEHSNNIDSDSEHLQTATHIEASCEEHHKHDDEHNHTHHHHHHQHHHDEEHHDQQHQNNDDGDEHEHHSTATTEPGEEHQDQQVIDSDVPTTEHADALDGDGIEQHQHHHDHHNASSSSSTTSSPLEEGTGKERRRKRRQTVDEENAEPKEPFGGGNEEQIEKKEAGQTSGQGHSTTVPEPAGQMGRLVRAIGIGHRARSQSVQKSQQQAGRGPKSDGTD